MAYARGMKVSTYIKSRIKTDMLENGYTVFMDQKRFLVFYKKACEEKTYSTETLEDAEEKIQELKQEEQVTDILLVDTVKLVRKVY